MRQWMHEQGYMLRKVPSDWEAIEGHLHLLKWLNEKRCPWGLSAQKKPGVQRGEHYALLGWTMSCGFLYDKRFRC